MVSYGLRRFWRNLVFIFLLFHFVSGIFVPNSTRYLEIILHVLNKLFLESLQKTRRPTVIFRQIVFWRSVKLHFVFFNKFSWWVNSISRKNRPSFKEHLTQWWRGFSQSYFSCEPLKHHNFCVFQKMSADNKRRLIFSIVQFLNKELADDHISDDAKESLEVASQCLQTAYCLAPEDTHLEVSKDLESIFTSATQSEPVSFSLTIQNIE